MKPHIKRFVFFFTLFLIFVFPREALAVVVGDPTVPSSVLSGDEFEVSFTATELLPGSIYYAKGLGGDGFNEVDTFNSDWLQQNASWSSMPTFTSNSDGIGNITLTVRFDSETSSGDKEFKVRIRKTDGSTNYDSSVVMISVTKPSPSPTATPTSTPFSTPAPTQSPTSAPTKSPTPKPTKTPTPKPTSTASSEPSGSGLVLGDTFVGLSTPTPTPTPTTTPKKINLSGNLPLQALGLVVCGMGFMGYGGYTFYIKKKNETVKV